MGAANLQQLLAENGCNSRFYPVIFQGLQHDGWDAWTCKNWQPVCSKQAESQANPQNMQWDKQENNSCLWEGKIHNQWVSQNQNSQSSLGKERIMWNFTFVSWLWTSDTDLKKKKKFSPFPSFYQFSQDPDCRLQCERGIPMGPIYVTRNCERKNYFPFT